MKCPYCGYEWEERVKKPKECPKCKGRLDKWREKQKEKGDTDE